MLKFDHFCILLAPVKQTIAIAAAPAIHHQVQAIHAPIHQQFQAIHAPIHQQFQAVNAPVHHQQFQAVNAHPQIHQASQSFQAIHAPSSIHQVQAAPVNNIHAIHANRGGYY